MRCSICLVVNALLAACLLQAEVSSPAIAGRKESRAQVALSHDTSALIEALKKVPASSSSTAKVKKDDLSGLLSAMNKLQMTVTTSSESALAEADLPVGLSADYEKFKSTLPKATFYQAQDGSPSFNAATGFTQVTHYIVEEDLKLGELELLMYHRQALEVARQAKSASLNRSSFATSFVSSDPGYSTLTQAPLRAQTEQGKVVRWVPGSTLKYCILRWTFPSQDKYDLVKANMLSACSAWAQACNIKFEHVSAADDAPINTVFPLDANGKRRVLFVVAHKDIGDTIAVSFFPNDSIYSRVLFVDPEEYFDTSIDKIGILRHELGHILGFRHEHISPNAPVWTSAFCSVESAANSTAVTAYERASVMHYPCAVSLTNGALPANLKLEITELDKVGSQAVYGPPGGLPTGNLLFRDFDPAP